MEVRRENLRSLFHDPAHYIKAFHAFMKFSDAFPVQDGWVDLVFPSNVVERLTTSFQKVEGPIRMLGVGSGSGELDLKMALQIRVRFVKVHNTVIEPTPDQLDRYRHLLDQTAHKDANDIEFDFRQQTIEQYREDRGNHGAKFHFISAIHSLYYVDDEDAVIEYLYDLLEDGGVLLVDIVSDESGSKSLYDAFPQTQDELNRSTTSQHIRESLEKRSIPYQTSRQEVRVDLTRCLDESQPSCEQSDLILDFMSRSIEFRKSASPEFFREFVEFLRSDKCSERGPNDTILFNINYDTLIVQKLSK